MGTLFPKRCNHCKEWKTLDAFSINRSKWDGLQPACRECQTKMNKINRNKPGGKAKAKLAREKRKGNNPLQKAAYAAVKAALRSGQLVKPSTCEQCFHPERPVQSHHRSYKKEDQLKVLWVCKPCHDQLDKSRKTQNWKDYEDGLSEEWKAKRT